MVKHEVEEYNMTTLVLGANGATGQLVVKQLLAKNEDVKVIVRSVEQLNNIFTNEILQDKRLSVFEASIMDLSTRELASQVKGCHAVISCLGHNLTFKGMFAQPRRLVKDTVERVCQAITMTSPTNAAVKFILMNTTGNQNKLAGEIVSPLQTIVVKLIRALIPPHADNEDAARYLQQSLCHRQKQIEWVVVRPDSLINNELVTDYDLYESPTRSAIFDAGKSSRINVAHFISELIVNKTTWQTWENKMPVLYNAVA